MNMELDLTLQKVTDIEEVWKWGVEDNIWITEKKVTGEKLQVGSYEIYTLHKPYSGYNTKVDAWP